MPAPQEASSAGATSTDFSCSICFDTATEPVVTKCGHLYCWPCLETWLKREPECPMCKGHIDPNTAGDVIPLYGKGQASGRSSRPGPSAPSSASTEPHDTARPRANREAPLPRPERENGFRFGLRQHGGWGGGAFIVAGFPSVVPWPVMLLLIGVALLYRFAPWRQWIGWNNDERGEHENAPAANQPRQQTDMTHIALIVLAMSVFLWMVSDT